MIYSFYNAKYYHQKYLEKDLQEHCHVDLTLIDD